MPCAGKDGQSLAHPSKSVFCSPGVRIGDAEKYALPANVWIGCFVSTLQYLKRVLMPGDLGRNVAVDPVKLSPCRENHREVIFVEFGGHLQILCGLLEISSAFLQVALLQCKPRKNGTVSRDPGMIAHLLVNPKSLQPEI